MIAPSTEAELAKVIAAADAPFAIQGGGTRSIGQLGDHQRLSTAGLNGISLYEPGALTIVAGAGTPLEDVEAALAQHNQQLPFEPMDHRGLLGTSGTPTIGGVLATNTSGPRRLQAGAARDLALGVRFVDGQGTIVKNGGRVMKNVTGIDLVRLMAGAWGTLGVLTEVAFKVLPKVEATASVGVEVRDPAQAVAAMSAALATPFDPTGAAYLDGSVHIRLEGFSASVAYRAEQMAKRLAKFGNLSQTENPTALWQEIRDVKAFQGKAGDVWKISVKPTDGPRVAAQLPGPFVLDLGGGLIWALTPEGTDVRPKLGGIAGHATLVRASDATKDRIKCFAPQDPAIALLSQGLKQKFDPKGLLNPGRMG